MSPSSPSQPQLPQTSAIELDESLRANTEDWFCYEVKVQPHHTDYAGIVWHGSYLTWMEEARIDCLRSIGIEFADLVAIGCDLPVVELDLRYHQPLKLGESAIVKTRMLQGQGVRIEWSYRIEAAQTQQLCVSGKVTLVAVDREKGKIMRQLPATVKAALVKLNQ